MKKIYSIILTLGVLLGLGSCSAFLEKPDTTGTYDLDVIYSSQKNAHAALMDCYRNILRHGLGGGWGVSHGVISNISGERARGYNWHGTYHIAATGLSPLNTGENAGGADNYVAGWGQIRACYLVIQNIDRVPDMPQNEKDRFKAEARGLIAYRYMGMFYRYGGLPKVEKAFDPEETPTFARMTLAETEQFIYDLCDEAIDGLPAGDLTPTEKGRLTRGAVLAMKARVAQFAARPLFNTANPYWSLGKNNDLICFGEEDAQRWNTAIEYNEAVLTWAKSNGYNLIKTGNEDTRNTFDEAVRDYGRATSEPSNPEAILQYKVNSWDYGVFKYIQSTPILNSYTGERWDLDESGLLTNSLEKYYTRDGQDQDWPKTGDPARPASDWISRINNMEARLLVDNIFATDNDDHVGNPGSSDYKPSRQGKPLVNSGTDDKYPNSYSVGHGPRASKFYYNGGNRVWTELPLFRLAETYLNLAEAYNETGNSSKALENLNKIHLRAGLPAITEANKDNLRKIIQRERALELYAENHRYFDAKHWMIDDIDNGGLCGPMREFQYYTQSDHGNDATKFITYWDAVTYNAFWANYMYLEPFPQNEVNKGSIIQNPGY